MHNRKSSAVRKSQLSNVKIKRMFKDLDLETTSKRRKFLEFGKLEEKTVITKTVVVDNTSKLDFMEGIKHAELE